MHEKGTWPFKPLVTEHDEMPLANGGVVLIDGHEQRDLLHGDGYLDYTYSYRAPGGASPETFGQCGPHEGAERHPNVYLVGSLIVSPSPEGSVLHVRTAIGKWNHYRMTFPRARTSPSGATEVQATFLQPEEDARIRASLDDEEREHWDISLYLRRFDPETRRLFVLFDAKRRRYLTLELSADGTKLRLLDVNDGEPP